jgi:hypothetical protein
MRHPPRILKEIVNLRKSGLSIDSIVLQLSIPKTTVWHHIKGIEIKPKLKLLLRSQQGGSHKRKLLRISASKVEAERLLNSNHREIAVAAAMIYWAEGTKGECEFINSDGKMIQLFLLALRKVFMVSENRIKPTVRYFTGMDRESCLNYWSQVTGIDKKQFTVRYNDGGTKCRTEFGMCRITVRKGSEVLHLLVSLRELYFNGLCLKK